MEDMETMRVRLTGTLPLLMHNEQLANPLDPAVQELKPFTSKRKKSEEDYLAISYKEFKYGLYHNEKLGPYIPAGWLKALIRDAAKITRRGTDVTRAVFIMDLHYPLEYKGPRDIETMYKEGFYDRRMVGNQGNRVLRTRPKFEGWAVEFEMMYDTTIFDNPTQMEGIINTGGRMIGLGDYRPTFGRFTAEYPS